MLNREDWIMIRKMRDKGCYLREIAAQEFVERLMRKLPGLFSSLEEFRAIWFDPDQREALIRKLAQSGFDGEQLATLRRMFAAEQNDLFDLLGFLTFEKPMKTRRARAEAERNNAAFFSQFDQQPALDAPIINPYDTSK